MKGFGGEGGQMEEETFPLWGSEGGFYTKVTLGIIEAAENLEAPVTHVATLLKNGKKGKQPVAVAVSVFSVAFHASTSVSWGKI